MAGLRRLGPAARTAAHGPDDAGHVPLVTGDSGWPVASKCGPAHSPLHHHAHQGRTATSMPGALALSIMRMAHTGKTSALQGFRI